MQQPSIPETRQHRKNGELREGKVRRNEIMQKSNFWANQKKCFVYQLGEMGIVTNPPC